MRKYLFCLLFLGYIIQGFAQTFQYNETFTNSSIRKNDIVFDGDPVKAFLTAGSKDVNDPEGKGFLRLTNADNNQKGYIYCKTPFSSSQGFSIQFEYFTYGGGDSDTGADGITFFLFDASAVTNNAFHIGGFGGSLGYAPFSLGTAKSDGLTKAYIGVGIDEYGNFKMKKEGRNSGDTPNGFDPPPRNSITVRGPATSDYLYVANAQTKETYGFQIATDERAADSLTVGYRKCYIDMERIGGNSSNGYTLTVKILEGGPSPKLHTVINKMEYKYAPPSELMYGIASSTGDSRNIHEIRNVRINSFQVTPPEPPVAVNDFEAVPKDAYTKKTTIIDVLSNDTAEKGHTIPPNKVFLNKPTSVNGGALTVDPATGSVSYTPKAGYVGPDSFTYYVADDRDLQSLAATVYLSVKQQPVGKPDLNIPVNIGERILDYFVKQNDPDSLNTTFEPVRYPNASKIDKGNFKLDPDGKFSYIPVEGSYSDSFTYRIKDANGVYSDEILVTIKINYRPVAVDDPTYYVVNNKQFDFKPVILNDEDDDSSQPKEIWAMRTETVSGPFHSTEDPNPDINGTYIYKAENYIGKDSITYKFKDELGLYSNDAKIRINVYPKPKIGLAKSASFEEAKGSSYNITYKFYIKNLNPSISDFSNDDQMLFNNVSIVDDISKALNGTDFTMVEFVSLFAPKDKSTLRLNPFFTGKKTSPQDSISIQLLDIERSYLNPGVADSFKLVINVKFNRSSPWAINNQADAKAEFLKLRNADKVAKDLSYNGTNPDNYQIDENTPVVLPPIVKPLAKDTIITRYADDPPFLENIVANRVSIEGKKTINVKTFTISRSSGNVASAEVQADSVKFTLNGQIGTTIFIYTVKDTLGVESNTGKITIITIPAPVGVADEYATLTNQEIAIMDLKKNDPVNTDYGIEEDVAEVEPNPNGTFKYTPKTDFYGDTTFTYRLINLFDGKKSAPITVSIHVNNPPIGTDAAFSAATNTSLPINISDLTSDIDGTVNKASVTILNPQLQGGTLIPNPNIAGTYIFTPASGFSGTVTFQYTIADNDAKKVGTSAPKTITINVSKTASVSKIGLAKDVAIIAAGANNSYDLKYTFTIKNYSQEELRNLSLTDDLGLAFSNAQFIVKSLTTQGTLTANNSFNGFSNIEILDKGNSKLAAGASEIVELILNVKLIDKDGIFINTAFTEADPASGGSKVKDQSTSGRKPDPADDGDVSPKDPTLIELLFPGVFIPQGFSPNNDGTNDQFVIRNLNNRKASIEIFNRWGNRVYKSADYQNDWNGKCTEGVYLGQDLPPGTYFYIILIEGKDKFTGYITLNR